MGMRRSWASFVMAAVLAGGVEKIVGQGVMVGSNRPQQTAPAGPAGTVTGTVILGDTQHPGRLAQVTLMSVEAADTSARSPEGQVQGIFNGIFGGSASGRTGLDGTFTIPNVKPGDYYVVASAPGYVTERAVLQAALAAGATVADLAAQLPMVHVTAEGSSSATVMLQRGGSVAGRVQWEDGSPASAVQIMAEPVVPPPALPPPLNAIRLTTSMSGPTDDRGAFRTSGLASGDYFVYATISPQVTAVPVAGRVSNFSVPIRVYVPGVFRKSDAKPVSVRAGDDRSDLQMVIDLRGLHTVSGHVSSTAGQSIVSGRVSLTDSVDATLQPAATINANGDFSVSYVPQGTYTMTVFGSTQTGPAGGRRSNSSSGGVTFKVYSQSLTVTDTDVTNLAVSLTPVS